MNPFEPPPSSLDSGRFPGGGPTGIIQRALAIACQRVERALHTGKLISPLEALALAGPEARSKETLFSIARAVAWELDCDQDDLLRELGQRFPRFNLNNHHDHTLMSDT